MGTWGTGPFENNTAARGRPRDAGRDAAILDATVHALTELGYEQMSIEAVAARAGVAKTTICRRYPDKASLVVAAIEQLEPAAALATRSEDLRGALLEVVRWLAREIAGGLPAFRGPAELAASGDLAVPVAATFPLAEVKAAYTTLSERKPFGRVVLRPQE